MVPMRPLSSIVPADGLVRTSEIAEPMNGSCTMSATVCRMPSVTDTLDRLSSIVAKAMPLT